MRASKIELEQARSSERKQKRARASKSEQEKARASKSKQEQARVNGRSESARESMIILENKIIVLHVIVDKKDKKCHLVYAC